jgi:hypothetical protein
MVGENVWTEQRQRDCSCSDAGKRTHFYSKSCSVRILKFIFLSCVSNTSQNNDYTCQMPSHWLLTYEYISYTVAVKHVM